MNNLRTIVKNSMREAFYTNESNEPNFPSFERLVIDDVVINGQPWENNSGFTIYEFSSKIPKKGNARSALKKLKQKFGKISVTDIGESGDPSYEFWKHMLENKLVDVVADVQGIEHTDSKTMNESVYLQEKLLMLEEFDRELEIWISGKH